MYLNSIRFTPTAEFIGFAQSFCADILNDPQLREYAKAQRAVPAPQDGVTPEEVRQSLDALRDRLDRDGSPMGAQLGSLLSALTQLQRVAELPAGAAPDARESEELAQAWRSAVGSINTVNGYAPSEDGSEPVVQSGDTMRNAAHAYLVGGETDPDRQYDAVQRSPEGLTLLHLGDLAEKAMLKLAVLEQEAAYTGFLYEERDIIAMNRQAETDFFSDLTDEEEQFLLSDAQQQQKKLQELAVEQNKVRTFRNNGEMVRTEMLNDRKYLSAWLDLQTEGRASARAKLQEEANEYAEKVSAPAIAEEERKREAILARNRLIEERNAAKQKTRQNLQNVIALEQDALEKNITKLKSVRTREQAERELNAAEGSPFSHQQRAEKLRSERDALKLNETLLQNAMEYPRKLRQLEADSSVAEGRYRLQRLKEKRELLDRLDTLNRLKNNPLRDQTLPPEPSKKEQETILKAWGEVRTLLEERDRTEEKLRGSGSEKERQSLLALTETVRQKRTQFEETFGKAGTVLSTLEECRRLFRDRAKEFTYKNLGSDKLNKTRESLYLDVQEQYFTLQSSEGIKEYAKYSSFMESEDYRRLKDKTPEQLGDELKKTGERLAEVSARLEEEQRLLRESRERYAAEEDAAKRLRTEESIRIEINNVRRSRQISIDAQRAELAAVKPDEELLRVPTDGELREKADGIRRENAERWLRRKEAAAYEAADAESWRQFNRTKEKEFLEPYRKREDALNQKIDRLVSVQDRFRQLYQTRIDSYRAAEGVEERWNAARAHRNPYPEQLSARLDSLCREVDVGRKKGHRDTEEYRRMAESLRAVRDLLGEPNAAFKRDRLRNLEPEKLTALRSALHELDTASKHYYDEKMKWDGLHILPSNMRKLRLKLSKELQSFAAETAAELSKMETVRRERTAEGEQAVEQAKERSVNQSSIGTPADFLADGKRLAAAVRPQPEPIAEPPVAKDSEAADRQREAALYALQEAKDCGSRLAGQFGSYLDYAGADNAPDIAGFLNELNAFGVTVEQKTAQNAAGEQPDYTEGIQTMRALAETASALTEKYASAIEEYDPESSIYLYAYTEDFSAVYAAYDRALHPQEEKVQEEPLVLPGIKSVNIGPPKPEPQKEPQPVKTEPQKEPQPEPQPEPQKPKAEERPLSPEELSEDGPKPEPQKEPQPEPQKPKTEERPLSPEELLEDDDSEPQPEPQPEPQKPESLIGRKQLDFVLPKTEELKRLCEKYAKPEYRPVFENAIGRLQDAMGRAEKSIGADGVWNDDEEECLGDIFRGCGEVGEALGDFTEKIPNTEDRVKFDRSLRIVIRFGNAAHSGLERDFGADKGRITEPEQLLEAPEDRVICRSGLYRQVFQKGLSEDIFGLSGSLTHLEDAYQRRTGKVPGVLAELDRMLPDIADLGRLTYKKFVKEPKKFDNPVYRAEVFRQVYDTVQDVTAKLGSLEKGLQEKGDSLSDEHRGQLRRDVARLERLADFAATEHDLAVLEKIPERARLIRDPSAYSEADRVRQADPAQRDGRRPSVPGAFKL